jgi:hypothetical protein
VTKTKQESGVRTTLLHDVDLALQLGELTLHFDVQFLHCQQKSGGIVCR